MCYSLESNIVSDSLEHFHCSFCVTAVFVFSRGTTHSDNNRDYSCCVEQVTLLTSGSSRPPSLSLRSHIVGADREIMLARTLDIVRKTLTTYIRPILEYNSNVWNPSHKYLIDQLENVQRRFTKRVTSLKNYSYPERLAILGLEPLECRRLRCDLIQYYKIFNNLTSLNPAENFTVHQPSLSSHASSSIILIKPFKRPIYVASSFFYRSIDCWNSLSPTLKKSK